jgi:rubrerythrin
MTTVVTKAIGGCAKPVGVLYIEPAIQAKDAGSSNGLVETGLHPSFTADLLSACLAHERCGVHLYRSIAARTTMEEMRKRYEHFGQETLEHVRLLEELITATGGDPMYVSPSARVTEKVGAGLVESTYELTGSIDIDTAELAMLEAVVLAETKDHANWELLAQLAAAMNPGNVRTQLEAVTSEVLAQEEEHVGWARDARARMLFGLATGGAAPSPARADEVVDLSARTKDELYAQAQDLEIEGRSQMTKSELAEAVAAQTGVAR